MLKALTELSAYQWKMGVSDVGLLVIGDLNNDLEVTNADIQSLLNDLAFGSGSIQPVPQPACACLLFAGILSLLAFLRRLQFAFATRTLQIR
jgi:hypothetical protein